MNEHRLVITETGFLTEFLNQHTQRIDRPYCFILGAGVSRPSGIPTGGELAGTWLREIYEAENFDGLSLEAWATAERLGIPGFSLENLALFYPQLYLRRYGDHEQSGYAFLENQMEGKEPSYGYSVLAYLLSETPHKVVITTNFDNLVADALSIHSSRFPLVIGHDSLTEYAAVELRRPLVAKIHGALGFTPKSRPEQITGLSEGWKKALRRILDRYTPIIIGYEGNDGSLMTFLESLPAEIPDRIFWCVYARDTKASDCENRVPVNVHNYVQERRGRFVPIRGFDELMAKLLSKLREKGSVPDLYERLKDRARQRERAYDEQQRKLFEAASPVEQCASDKSVSPSHAKPDLSLSQAVTDIAESRKEKPWWVWVREALNAQNHDSTEGIFKEALKALPENPDILRSYALFFEQDRKDNDKAEEYYMRAIEANPVDAKSLGFYADFLERYRAEIDKAEQHYQRALEADPNDSYNLTQYARFLEKHGKNFDKAEELYQRAVGVEPNDAYSLSHYAQFLQQVRQNMDKAEELYQRAVEAEPNDAYSLSHYAQFLQQVRQNMDKAEGFYQRTIEAKPNNAYNLTLYARFLQQVRQNMDKAEELYWHAVDVEPNNTFALTAYADFLQNVRQDLEKSEQFRQRARSIHLKETNRDQTP